MGEPATGAVLAIDLPAREGGPHDAIICRSDGLAQLTAAALRFGDRPRFLIADETVAGLHGAAVRAALGDPPLVLAPAGEAAKSLAVVERLASALVQHGVRRDAVLFALGGGALCDVAGFLAATLLRGIDHVLLPTTLLGMVDAAIGGKTAVNLPSGKNLVGVFHQPRLVLCDLHTLTTLPSRDRHAGLGEVLKHALLEGEAALRELELSAERLRDDPPAALFDVVRRSIEWKAKIVVLDPRERRGLRRKGRTTRSRPVVVDGREILNLGHTLGHALELASHKTGAPLRHGEAVGLGLLAEAHIGAALGLWTDGAERIESILPRLGLPHDLAAIWASLSVDVVRSALSADKKNTDDKLRFVLLDQPGRPLAVALDADRALEILLGDMRVIP